MNMTTMKTKTTIRYPPVVPLLLQLFLLVGSVVVVEARGLLRVSSSKQTEQQNLGQEQQLPQIHIIIRQRKLQGALGELEGLGGNPEMDHYPLQLCEGDCDDDVDCDAGLYCFQRDPFEAVPGCIGGEEAASRTDFCVPDPSFGGDTDVTTDVNGGGGTPPTPTRPPQANNGTTAASPPPTPTLPDPVPTPAMPSPPMTNDTTITTTPQPTTPNPTLAPVPASPVAAAPTPASSPTASGGGNVAPTTSFLNGQITLEIEKVGNNGFPSSAYPLGECQGDCDDDDECQDGLICYHRNGGEPTPGCLGEDRSRNDYCIKDPTTFELYIPPTASPTNAPTQDTIGPTTSNQPSLRPSVSLVPSSFPSDFPSDVPSDVPSTVPTSSSNPTISPAPTVPPSGSPTVQPLEGIRIKLYWEEGYNWQDETVERRWCMIRDYRGFPGTGKCWHGLHTEPCHSDMIYVSRCDTDKRQMFSIYPMPGGSQYQVALFDEKSNEKNTKCLERMEYSLVLRDCNYMNPLQRFWMPRGAVFQKRFELSPITLANHCVTQAHHPKSGEVVELHKCSRARSPEHLSSFWTIA